MTMFNKRKRDNKGSGKIRLDDNSEEQTSKKGIQKKHILWGGGLLAAGLVGAFLFSSGSNDNEIANNDQLTTSPPKSDTVITTPDTKDTPSYTIQTLSQRNSEKVSTISNRSDCLYEAFVNSSNREVSQGNSFSHFACL